MAKCRQLLPLTVERHSAMQHQRASHRRLTSSVLAIQSPNERCYATVVPPPTFEKD